MDGSWGSNDGQVAVFMPGAPDPSSRVVQIVSTDHITPLDISYRDALAFLEQSGRGLPNLLRKQLNEKNLGRHIDGNRT